MIYNVEEVIEEIKSNLPSPKADLSLGDHVPWWLRFHSVCDHDDLMLCSCRHDFMMSEIRRILEREDKDADT